MSWIVSIFLSFSEPWIYHFFSEFISNISLLPVKLMFKFITTKWEYQQLPGAVVHTCNAIWWLMEILSILHQIMNRIEIHCNINYSIQVWNCNNIVLSVTISGNNFFLFQNQIFIKIMNTVLRFNLSIIKETFWVNEGVLMLQFGIKGWERPLVMFA